MDQKRVALAVGLSFLVVFAWSYFMPSKQEAPTSSNQTVQQAQAPAETAQAPATTASMPQALDQSAFTPSKGEKLVVDTPLYRAVFNSQGGILEGLTLKKYKQTIDPGSPDVDLIGEAAQAKAPMGLIINGVATWSAAKWSHSGQGLTLDTEPGQIVFTGIMDGFRIERCLLFSPDTYLIKEDVILVNETTGQLSENILFTAAARSLSAEDDRYNPTRVSYYTEADGLTEETDRDDLTETGVSYTGGLDWGAIQSNYFLVALIPGQDQTTLKARIQDGVFRLSVSETVMVPPSSQSVATCSYFIGPCDREILATAPNNLERAVDFGWFDFIAEPLLIFLVWINQYVHNYGIAIILLTIVIKILFWPLSQKSYKSMEQMKKLQPMMTEIREKYKDNKERMNQELMQLYKTYKVNPAGGCVPMLLQIPVFFGLYKALMGAIELRHAVFIEYLPFTNKLWLADLSAKDPYYITPIIMGATMFLQQKMSPQAGDPTQQKVMLLMPLIFTFLFLNFPSGLVIYWMVNNILSIAQQWWMMRKA